MELTLHQALFGYDGGHQLLAASLHLPTDAKHFLAVATDLSGSAPPTGFDQAYTGMPLPETDFYALFSTWLAPEMPRPGCVWSHVVLIELADLARLSDLDEMRMYFRRPNKTDEKAWREPLSFVPRRNSAIPVCSSQETDCLRLLGALYGTAHSPAVIDAPTSETYSDLVFALWSQQWPRLRRNFRFSTGSFADRGRIGTPFDLQITPTANLGAWQRREKERFLEVTENSPDHLSNDKQDWLRVALDDLRNPDATEFRSFLSAYGADVENPRSAFGRLTTAFERLHLHPGSSWMDKLRSIAEIFPNESDAVRLKEWLTKPQKDLSPVQDIERAWATASFLLSPREARAYAKISFDHAALAPCLWQQKREKVLSLLARLVRQKENPTATAFAAAIANAAQASELKSISETHPDLIPAFISHRPSLAFEVSTWELPESTQWQITEVLNKLSLDQKTWGEIMAAKFVAATFVAVRESVEKAGGCAIKGISRWLESSIGQECLPSQLWREALATPVADCLRDQESLSPTVLALCAWIVPPEIVRQLLAASRQDVQQLAQQPLDRLPRPLLLPTAFLLVTLGLRASGLEGIKLIKRGYFEVYDALATSTATNLNFPWESWLLLSSELPQPGIFRDWDRCKRLRRAVRQWIARYAPFENPLLTVAAKKEYTEIARKTLEPESETDEFTD